MGMFIRIDINDKCDLAASGGACIAACPVDIFARDGDRVITVEANEDECTLCGLCINACPAGAVSIVKLYEEQ